MKRRLNYGLINDDAADAQLSTSQTRESAQERERQLLRAAAFESHHRGAEVDMGFKHGNELSMLKARQAERDGNIQESLSERQEALEQQMQVTGLRKTLRDISGRSGKDQDELEAVQKTLADFEFKNNQEIEQLKKSQAQEEQTRRDDMQKRFAYIEQQQELENNTRLEQQRQQAAEVRERVTTINSNEPPRPSPAWEQEPAIEQQNTPPISHDFNEAMPTREAYIAEQSHVANEPQSIPSPSHEFENAAPAPSQGRER